MHALRSKVDEWFGEGTILPICLAGFIMSVGQGIMLVSLPFIVKRFGGSDGDAGLSLALNFASYVVACLGATLILDRFNPKRLAQIGAIAAALPLAGLCLVISAGPRAWHPIAMIDIAVSLVGGFTALFWPPMMGWISRGFEGKQLGHRLGSFNISWSSGGWVSPYIGGLLVASSSTVAILIAFLVSLCSWFAVTLARNPRHTKHPLPAEISEQPDPDRQPDVSQLNPELPRFRWMARLALPASFACIGVVRSQLGLHFKFDLHYSEAMYGIAITAMCLCNFLMFWAAGRIHSWHYVRWPFFTAQMFVLLSMVMILGFEALWLLIAAAGLLGFAEAFMYASHLFYGVSGARKRTTMMAVHEFLLSTGMVFGSVCGGYLSDGFGRYSPYWLGLGIVAAAIAAELVVWRAIPRSNES
jgi:MFS family permease